MKLICCAIFVIAFTQGLLAAPNQKVEEPTNDNTHKIPVNTKADVKSVAENEPAKAISERDSNESSYDSRDFDKIWAEHKAADAPVETSDQGKNSAVKTDVLGKVSGTDKINKDDSHASGSVKASVSVDVNESVKSSVVNKSDKSKLKKDVSSKNKSKSESHGSGSAESPKLTAPKPVKSAKSTEKKGKDGKSPLDSKSESFEYEWNLDGEAKNVENIHDDGQNGRNLEDLKKNISGQISNEAENVDFQWEAHIDGSDSGSFDINREWDYSNESSKVDSVKVTTKTDTNATATETNTPATSTVIVVNGTDSSKKPSTHQDISNTHSTPHPATATKETSHSHEHLHENGNERDHFAHNRYNHGHGYHGQSASDEGRTASEPQTNSESKSTSDASENTQNPDTISGAPVRAQNADTGSGALVDSDTPTSNAPVDTQNPDIGSDAPVDSDTPTSDASVDTQNPDTTSDSSVDTQNPDEYRCRLSKVPTLPKKHFVSGPEIICSCACPGNPKLDCSCNCIRSRDCQ